MPARKNHESDADSSLTFEAALDRLQTIVGELEGGRLSLEDSIARYEEGMKLSRRLTEELERTHPMDPANGPRDPDDPREGELPF